MTRSERLRSIKEYAPEFIIPLLETIVCVWVELRYGMFAGFIAGILAVLVLGICHFWFFEPRYKLSRKEDERARIEASKAYRG